MREAKIRNIHLYIDVISKFLRGELSFDEFLPKYESQWGIDQVDTWDEMDNGVVFDEENTHIVSKIVDMVCTTCYDYCEQFLEPIRPPTERVFELDENGVRIEIGEIYRSLVILAKEFSFLLHCQIDVRCLGNDRGARLSHTVNDAFTSKLQIYTDAMRLFLRRELSVDEFISKYQSQWISDRDDILMKVHISNANNTRIILCLIDDVCYYCQCYTGVLVMPNSTILESLDENGLRIKIEEIYRSLVALAKEFSFIP